MSVDRGWIFRDCVNSAALVDPNLGSLFLGFVRDAGFTVHATTSKKFEGAGGVTACVIIGESSVDIHTWPETGTAHIRLFYCDFSEQNDEKAKRFLVRISEHFQPTKIDEVTRREFPI